jgi:PAS domain S-box-containing protein
VTEVSTSTSFELVLGSAAMQRVGRFSFLLDGQRWEWSDTVARMHGYEPGEVEPTTDLLLRHKHPDDRAEVGSVLEKVLAGEPFSSRHRIIDTKGHIHTVIVVGDRLVDSTGCVTGSTGFYVDVTEALGAEIQQTVDVITTSRSVIEQAKGILMAVYGISAERAFDVLTWRSQETNVKVRELCRSFIEAIKSLDVPVAIRSQVDHILVSELTSVVRQERIPFAGTSDDVVAAAASALSLRYDLTEAAARELLDHMALVQAQDVRVVARQFAN